MSPRSLLQVGLLIITVAAGSVSAESGAEDLRKLLDDFLAGASAGDARSHDAFWAEDLVYTSSDGTRTDKPAIMKEVGAADPNDSDPPVVYTAEQVDIRLYGDTAVVAFRLVGTPQGDDSEAAQYFNTGTFLKRDGRWQAVAWQATRIHDVPAQE